MKIKIGYQQDGWHFDLALLEMIHDRNKSIGFLNTPIKEPGYKKF